MTKIRKLKNIEIWFFNPNVPTILDEIYNNQIVGNCLFDTKFCLGVILMPSVIMLSDQNWLKI